MKNLSLDASEVPRIYRVLLKNEDGTTWGDQTVTLFESEVPGFIARLRKDMDDTEYVEVYPA